MFAKAGPAQVIDQESDTVAPWSSFLVACFQTFPHLLVSYFCLQHFIVFCREHFFNFIQQLSLCCFDQFCLCLK